MIKPRLKKYYDRFGYHGWQCKGVGPKGLITEYGCTPVSAYKEWLRSVNIQKEEVKTKCK